MYKVFDNKMEELVAYELISANDAPERDPMDWYYFQSSLSNIPILYYYYMLPCGFIFK